MWIELPDEIEEYLCNITNAMEKSALALNALFDSMLKGKHVVFASRKLLNQIEKLNYINKSNRDFICWIKQKYVYLYACKEVVEYKIKVTSRENTFVISDKLYEVSLSYFYDIQEVKLLTENESDGEFLEGIYRYIKNKNGMSKYFDIKFENDSCHGGNVSAKIIQTSKEKRISLCILDSDQEMAGAKKGDTYQGANNSYKKVKKNHIILLKELEVREKENLLSPNIYKIICEKNKTMLEVLECFFEDENILKYFDIKDGVKLKRYQDEVWKNYYQKVIDKLIEQGVFKIPEDEKKQKDFLCVEGIGEKACNVLCKLLLKDEEVCKKTLRNIKLDDEKNKLIWKIRENIEEYLPEYLYVEWKQLYKLLFDWGCCISRNNLPIYQL